mmetsp:Transcript_15655/g.27815  ORF Transcript_15655/g.27815 Transcript_15655/m.27815 type:complete len:362 (+) Transcript_15655:313-1398(+)
MMMRGVLSRLRPRACHRDNLHYAGVRKMSSRILGASIREGPETNSLTATLETHDGTFSGTVGGASSAQVQNSAAFVETSLTPALLGLDPTDQPGIDDLVKRVDGTEHLSEISQPGALAISIALVRAAAAALKRDVPTYFAIQSGEKSIRVPLPLYRLPNETLILPEAGDFLEGMKTFAELQGKLGNAGVELEDVTNTIIKERKKDNVELGLYGPQGHSSSEIAYFLTRHPSIKCILDPFTMEDDDLDEWHELMDEVDADCYIGPTVRSMEQLEVALENLLGDTIALDWSNMTNITEVETTIAIARKRGVEVFFAAQDKVEPKFFADFATGYSITAVELNGLDKTAEAFADIEKQINAALQK